MLSDFWWLSPEEATQYGYINLFHQEPYSDEPNTDKDPLSCPMLQSDKRCTLGFTNQWRKKFRNINVFRSFALYGSDSNGEAIVGPFLLDVDRTIEKEGGYIADIGKALEDARLLAKTCCSNLEDKHYRIFFTGHKGFHIEINPKSLNIPPNTDYSECFEHRRKDINNKLGNAFVDRLHSHVRLHNSINSWIDYSGHKVYSMSFEISPADLYSISAKDICAKGEALALKELKV